MIEKEIMNDLLSVDVGNYQEVKAAKVQEKIDRLIKMLNRSVTKWAKTAIPEIYDKGREVAETRLEILGAEQNEEFPKKTHEQSIEFEMNETIDTLIRANLSIKLNVATYLYIVNQAARRIAQIQEFDFRDEAFVSELLDDAIIAGETRTYAKNLVMGHIKDEVGEGNFIRIRGRNYNMKKYADTVAKTRLRTVQTKSVLNSCKEYDNDLVEVSSHGCDCIICETYEGGIFSLSGKSTTYPYLDSYPPWHPRCQHHIRPTSEEALKARGEPPFGRGQAGHMDYDEHMRMMEMGQRKYGISRLKAEHLRTTGKALSDDAAEKMYRTLQSFTGDESANMRLAQLGMRKHFDNVADYKKWLKSGNTLEDYLKFAPQFDPKTTIYRGVDSTGHKDLLKKLKNGEIKAGHKMALDTTSHWSSELTVSSEWDGAIIYETKGVKQSSAISHFSHRIPEQEVIVSKNVGYTIKKITSEGTGKQIQYRIILEPTG